MHYYPHDIDSFNSATRHCTVMERGIYRELLDIYYDKEKPISGSIDDICRKICCRTDEERACVERMLNEFFTFTKGAWKHSKCDEVIQKYKSNKKKKQEAGKKSGEARKAKSLKNKGLDMPTDAEHVLNGSSTDAEQLELKSELESELSISSLSSGDDLKPKVTKKTRSPNIPYDQVFDLYNKILAQGIGLPSVQARDDDRKRAIKKAWNYNKQANIDKHATNTIDYWERYFTHCSTLVWMQPDTPRGQGHEKWQPDFDYCINTKTLKKVIEGKIT